ncbi:MAG: thioredoxin domain-containing protein [Desulfobulbaceae bacterium]|nr:thioredoxin domain-containing protein [Desulfobulbaceae bacterium]
MLKILLCCSLLLVPMQLQAAPSVAQDSSNAVNSTVKASWALPAKPLDFAQSLDNKKVFILTDDATVHVFTAEGQKLGTVPVDAGVNSIDIAPRGEMLYLLNDRDNSYTAMDVSFNQQIDLTGAPIRGKQDAPVTIVEFSDFQCPFCSKIMPVLEKILNAHPDTVRVAFKHLPLNRIHPQAEPAARATIAAQKQGKFWELHDALFSLSETDWARPDVIETAAKQAGLEMARFVSDWNSEETRMKLAKDIMDAQNADVSATPSLFVNGKPVQDRSQEAIERMIAEALAVIQPAAKPAGQAQQ